MSSCGLCINGLCRYCHGTLYEDIYINKTCSLCGGKGTVKFLEEIEENKYIGIKNKCMNCVGTGTRSDIKRYKCSYQDCYKGRCYMCLFSR
jgi:DnaJ-class molecular chaperone